MDGWLYAIIISQWLDFQRSVEPVLMSRQVSDSRQKVGEGERPPPSSERLPVPSLLTFSASVCFTATS